MIAVEGPKERTKNIVDYNDEEYFYKKFNELYDKLDVLKKSKIKQFQYIFFDEIIENN